MGLNTISVLLCLLGALGGIFAYVEFMNRPPVKINEDVDVPIPIENLPFPATAEVTAGITLTPSSCPGSTMSLVGASFLLFSCLMASAHNLCSSFPSMLTILVGGDSLPVAAMPLTSVDVRGLLKQPEGAQRDERSIVRVVGQLTEFGLAFLGYRAAIKLEEDS